MTLPPTTAAEAERGATRVVSLPRGGLHPRRPHRFPPSRTSTTLTAKRRFAVDGQETAFHRLRQPVAMPTAAVGGWDLPEHSHADRERKPSNMIPVEVEDEHRGHLARLQRASPQRGRGCRAAVHRTGARRPARTWMQAWERPPLPKASPEPANVIVIARVACSPPDSTSSHSTRSSLVLRVSGSAPHRCAVARSPART